MNEFFRFFQGKFLLLAARPISEPAANMREKTKQNCGNLRVKICSDATSGWCSPGLNTSGEPHPADGTEAFVHPLEPEAGSWVLLFG